MESDADNELCFMSYVLVLYELCISFPLTLNSTDPLIMCFAALCVLILERPVKKVDELIYRSLVPLEWIFLITFPLIQAARLSSTGHSLKQRSLQTRVYGYPSATQLDLDSFLQFIHSIDLKARLFCMPMKKSYVCAAFTLAAFLLLLMFQTSIAAGNSSWF